MARNNAFTGSTKLTFGASLPRLSRCTVFLYGPLYMDLAICISIYGTLQTNLYIWVSAYGSLHVDLYAYMASHRVPIGDRPMLRWRFR